MASNPNSIPLFAQHGVSPYSPAPMHPAPSNRVLSQTFRISRQSAILPASPDTGGRENTTVSFKVAHFEGMIILVCVHWYLAYPLRSYHLIEERIEERGIEIDHSTLHRWVVEDTPPLERELRKRRGPVGLAYR